MARLQTVDAGILPQQAIAVELANVVPGEFLLLVVLVGHRVVADDSPGQSGYVAGGRVVLLVRPAGGIAELGIAHPQLPGLMIHVADEGILGPGHILGQGHRGIIAGLDDHALDQVFHSDLVANLDKHLRALHLPGLLADGNLVVEANVTVSQRLVHQVGRHQLGDAGRLHAHVGILLRQHLATLVVHQDIALDRQIGRLGDRPWRRGLQQARQQHQGQDDQGVKVFQHGYSTGWNE